jgi:hypothetical protein
MTTREIAKLGIAQSTVSRIISRKLWDTCASEGLTLVADTTDGERDLTAESQRK